MQDLLIKSEPLYMQLKNRLIKLIDKKNLTMLPREKDLEELFGVSRITVRKAIQELTALGKVIPVQGRGTMVAKHLQPLSRELGITSVLQNEHVDHLFSVAAEEARKLKYNLSTFILNFYDDNIALPSSNSLFSNLIATGKLNGLLLCGKLPYVSVEYLVKKKIPMVTAGIKFKQYDIPCVRLKFKRPIEKMTEKLIEAGFKQIAFLAIREGSDEKDEAIGEFHYFKKSYYNIIKKYGLREYYFPVDGKDTAFDAMKKLYFLPPEKRPNALVVYFYRDYQPVRDFLDDKKDWNPLLISSGDITSGIGIRADYGEVAKLSLQTLVEIIKNPGSKIEDKTLPIEIILPDDALKN